MQSYESGLAAAPADRVTGCRGAYYWSCPLTVWLIRGFILHGLVPEIGQTHEPPVPAARSHVRQMAGALRQH